MSCAAGALDLVAGTLTERRDSHQCMLKVAGYCRNLQTEIGAGQHQAFVCSMLVASVEQLQSAAVALGMARGSSTSGHLVQDLESIGKRAHMLPGK